MKIERYNYATQFGEEVRPLIDNIHNMLVNGRYVLTEEVERFEREFGNFIGAKYIRGVNTGTDALIIAMLALGVGPGDEVITQANTFYATVAAIKIVGAKPVLVDAEEESFLIAQEQISAAITPKTRVLLPVHLYGKPTPMSFLLELANKHGLFVVEDAAQAHGARINGQSVGTFGDIGCFSFHPSKNLAAAGDGGALVTNQKSLDELIRTYRELGQRGQNNHVKIALNSKLDAIQAQILSWKLPNLDKWNSKRREIASLYRERLEDLPLLFQSTNPNEEHVYHLFQVRTNCRDELMAHLKAANIDVIIRYPTPIHLQSAFAECGWCKGQFPVAEKLANELLCLPIRPDMELNEVDYVTQNMRNFFKS